MINVGDTVVAEWTVDRAYGGARCTFRGVVRAIDDWITIVDSKSTFHYPLSVLDGVRVEQTNVTNPFMQRAQANPFMNIAENPFVQLANNPFARLS